MDDQSAQIAAICECVDHCFAFAIWSDDFVGRFDPEEMVWGLDRGVELISDAARLQSFLALRKLDDFFEGVKPKPDDLIASDFGISVADVLGDVGQNFLTTDERTNINKGVAHLTERLSLESDTEVELQQITDRSMPVFSRLVVALRALDAPKEAADWLDRTEVLIKRAEAR